MLTWLALRISSAVLCNVSSTCRVRLADNIRWTMIPKTMSTPVRTVVYQRVNRARSVNLILEGRNQHRERYGSSEAHQSPQFFAEYTERILR